MAIILPREEAPDQVGSPEHFRRVCRGSPGKPVVCFCRVDGFRVPPDGVWMINKLWASAGTERDLIAGDRVTFYPASGVGPAEPRASAQDFARADPQTLAPIFSRRG